MKLETRAMPKTIATKWLEPRHNPRLCCFDTASVPPAWTAWKLCSRCKLVNTLLQGKCACSAWAKACQSAPHTRRSWALLSDYGPKAASTDLSKSLNFADCAESTSISLLRGLVGSAVFVTDCASQATRSTKAHQLPTLPEELVSAIVNEAIYDMDITHDPKAILPLMQTSAAIRLRIVHAFDPHEIQEKYCGQDASNAESLLISLFLIDYMWRAVEVYLARDLIGIRGFEGHALGKSRGSEVVRTKDRREFRQVQCRVNVRATELEYTRKVVEEQTVTKRFASADAQSPVTLGNVCDTVRDCLEDEALRGFPRCLMPCVHASRHGSFEVPEKAVTVKFTLVFRHDLGDSGVGHTRSWAFTNDWA